MTIEDQLKNYIKEKYTSIRQFTIQADIPYSTLDTMFKRGFNNSSVVNVNKVCRALNISADELARGEIVINPIKRKGSQAPRITEVTDLLAEVTQTLTRGAGLTLDGKPLTVDSMRTIVDMIDAAVEIARKKV